MSPPKKNFGSVLRATRVEKGFSLRKFAEKVGVSPTYLSLVETGQATYQPTVDRIKDKLAAKKRDPRNPLGMLAAEHHGGDGG